MLLIVFRASVVTFQLYLIKNIDESFNLGFGVSFFLYLEIENVDDMSFTVLIYNFLKLKMLMIGAAKHFAAIPISTNERQTTDHY